MQLLDKYLVTEIHPFLKPGLSLVYHKKGYFILTYEENGEKSHRFGLKEVYEWEKAGYVCDMYYYTSTFTIPRLQSITPENVISSILKVTEETRTSMEDIRRLRSVVRLRQLCMYYLRKLFTQDKMSLNDISFLIRPEKPLNHATILHGIKTIQNLIDSDSEEIRDIYPKLDYMFNIS
jgi:hypothetical protein